MSFMSPHDCAWCEDRALSKLPPFEALFARRFIVCPTCGNKRCPRASAHWLPCTDSNEPGQLGSFFGLESHWPKEPPTR